MWNLLTGIVAVVVSVDGKSKGRTDMRRCFIPPAENPDNFPPGLHQVIMLTDTRVLTGL